MSSRPSQTQLGDSVPADAWRRFHKLTPVLKGVAIWTALAVVAYNLAQNYFQNDTDPVTAFLTDLTFKLLAWIVLGAVIITVIVVFFAWMSWRFTSYAIVETGVHLRKGVFLKSYSHLRWDRVQSVEIKRSLLARIFKLGSVVVESAGSDDAIELGFLRIDECERLRAEIIDNLTRARQGLPISAGTSSTTTADATTPGSTTFGTTPSGAAKPASALASRPAGPFSRQDAPASGSAFSTAPAPAALTSGQPAAPTSGQSAAPAQTPSLLPFEQDGTQIYKLPTTRLVVAAMASPMFVFGLLFTIATTLSTVALGTTFVGIIIGLATTVVSWARGLFADFGTTVMMNDSGYRVRGGLTTTRTRAIPQYRIHAVEVVQPVLWRRADWWRVTPAVARSLLVDMDSQSDAIFPIATRQQAVDFLYTVLPVPRRTSLPVARDAAQPGAHTQDWEGLLYEAFEGREGGRHYIPAPRRSRWFDPVTRPARGVALTDDIAILRTGRFRRRITFVWRTHIQSRAIKQGPLQARLNLATLRLDLATAAQITVPSAENFDFETVRELGQQI